ncbi:hypothetical protein [Cyanobium sp. LEGE 06113]|uniref:hypothetical protein n=1 Tax=Cyanobium sp. LEGE 06113 TaxID=1297573 RepID=UPI0018820AB4|nr:hypothetical protein [Cyanobium sp. LEGE 06113]MBE9155183.1 hypothetical protein [Cyanobium sp. LEGE 06113]
MATLLEEETQAVRLYAERVVVRVPPCLVGPAHFKDRLVGGHFLVEFLERELERRVLLEPTHRLQPCPPATERLTLRQWAGRGEQPEEVNASTLGSVYRRVFGVDPRKAKGRSTRTYSRRELELLGVLA